MKAEAVFCICWCHRFVALEPKLIGQPIGAGRRQIRQNLLPRSIERCFTLDNSLPASDLLQSIQKLTNIIYLTKLDSGDSVKVRKYMTDAEAELVSLKRFVMKLAPNFSQRVN